MEQCGFVGCIKPAEVEHTIGADFSMTSTTTKSLQVTKICGDCAEMIERTKSFARVAVADMLK